MPSSGSLDGAACPAGRHCRRKRLPARATRQSRARFILPRTGRFVGVPGWQHRRSLATEAPLAPRSVPGGDGGPTQAPVPLTEQRARLAGTAVGSVYPPVQPGRAGPAFYCHGRDDLPSEAFTRPCNPTEPGPLHTATDGTICRRARLAAPPFTSHRGPAGPSIGTRWGWGSDPSSGSLDGAACPAGRHCRRKRLPARATRQSRARFLLPRAGRFVGVPGWQHRRSLATEAPQAPRSTRWVRGSDPSSGSLDGAACQAGRHCRRKRLPARATRQSRARFILPRTGRFVGVPGWQHRRSLATEAPLAPRSVPGGDGGPTQAPVPLTEQRARLAGTAVGSVYPPVQPGRAGPAFYCHGRDDLPSEAFTRPCNPAEPGPLHTATDGTICRRARLAAPPFTSHRGPAGPSIGTRWGWGSDPSSGSLDGAACPGWQALPSEAFTRPCNPAEPGPLSTATGGTICRRARLAAPPFTSRRGPAGPSIYPVGSGVRPKLRFPRRSSVPGWQALPSEAFTRPCNPAEPGPLPTATGGTSGGRLPAPGRPLNRSSRHAPIAFTLIWQLFIWPIPDFVSTPL